MYMKPHIFVILVFISALLCSPCVASTSSFNDVVGNVGETWIKLEWDSSVITNIYVDGKIQTDELSLNTAATNVTIGYFYLTDLNPNSQHTIRLVNASDSSDYKNINMKTLAPSSMVNILFVVCVLLSIVMLFIAPDFFKTVLVAIMNIVLSLFSMSLSYNFYGMYFMFWGFVIWSAVILGYTVYTTFKEDINWW